MQLHPNCLPGTCSMFELTNIEGYHAEVSNAIAQWNEIKESLHAKYKCKAIIANTTYPQTVKWLLSLGWVIGVEYWGNSDRNVTTMFYIVDPKKD